MTQEQEKAKELVNKFEQLSVVVLGCGKNDGNPCVVDDKMCMKDAKQCAIICVNEILSSEPRTPSNVDWDDCGGTHRYYYESQREEANLFWNKVLTEIEKL